MKLSFFTPVNSDFDADNSDFVNQSKRLLKIGEMLDVLQFLVEKKCDWSGRSGYCLGGFFLSKA